MRKGARPDKIVEFILLVMGICFPLAGCGHNPDLPPLAPVSGKVTLDGKPIDPRIRLHVQFIPDSASGTRGPAGSGGVAEDGSYSIITAGEDGAIVGTHTVPRRRPTLDGRSETVRKPKDVRLVGRSRG